MSRHILLIVEGKVTEPKIFGEIFKKYNFEVEVKNEQLSKTLNDNQYIFNISKLKKQKDTITIVQGTHSMLNHITKLYDKNIDDFELFFSDCAEHFNGVFYIYDIDHTTNENLEYLSNILNDETMGMLLVSSPCIEILSEPNRKQPLITNKLSKYKTERNIECHKTYKKDTTSYIIDNFESLIMYFLEQTIKNLMNQTLWNILY